MEWIVKEGKRGGGIYPSRSYEKIQELVRCKDCKFNYGNEHNCSFNPNDITCTYWESDGLQSVDFCSYGSRMNSSEKPNNCEDEFFREPTAEERKAVADYIDSISVPTGVNIFDLMDEQTERSG